MQGPQAIPVFRPSYLTDGVEFQGSLQESPAKQREINVALSNSFGFGGTNGTLIFKRA